MCTIFYSSQVALAKRLVRGERSENSNISRREASGAHKRPLLMNWGAVTDNDGNQKLGMHWTAGPPVIANKAKRRRPALEDGGRVIELPKRRSA